MSYLQHAKMNIVAFDDTGIAAPSEDDDPSVVANKIRLNNPFATPESIKFEVHVSADDVTVQFWAWRHNGKWQQVGEQTGVADGETYELMFLGENMMYLVPVISAVTTAATGEIYFSVKSLLRTRP